MGIAIGGGVGSLVSNVTIVGADYNWGTVGATTLRSAAQIGNAAGPASFGAGNVGAQTLRVALATDLAALLSQESTSQSIDSRIAALVAFYAANFGASTGAIRAAAQIGNASGAADFNAGAIGAQTLRVAAALANASGLADFNAGAIGAQTLRVAAILANASGVIDFNSGNKSAQTPRVVIATDQPAVPVTAVSGAVAVAANGTTTSTTLTTIYTAPATGYAEVQLAMTLSTSGSLYWGISTLEQGGITDGGTDFATSVNGGSNLGNTVGQSATLLWNAGRILLGPSQTLQVRCSTGTLTWNIRGIERP